MRMPEIGAVDFIHKPPPDGDWPGRWRRFWVPGGGEQASADQLHLDALKELVNTGMGKATSALNELLDSLSRSAGSRDFPGRSGTRDPPGAVRGAERCPTVLRSTEFLQRPQRHGGTGLGTPARRGTGVGPHLRRTRHALSRRRHGRNPERSRQHRHQRGHRHAGKHPDTSPSILPCRIILKGSFPTC